MEQKQKIRLIALMVFFYLMLAVYFICTAQQMPRQQTSPWQTTYFDYQYVELRIDPVGSQDGLNWGLGAGVVYKWILIGVETEFLKYTDNRPDFLRYSTKVGGVIYPKKLTDLKFILGATGGITTRRQERSSLSTATWGGYVQGVYHLGRHWAATAALAYDRRNDWGLLGWEVGWRHSGTLGLQYVF